MHRSSGMKDFIALNVPFTKVRDRCAQETYCESSMSEAVLAQLDVPQNKLCPSIFWTSPLVEMTTSTIVRL